MGYQRRKVFFQRVPLVNQFSDNPDYLRSTARILVITGMSGAGKTSTLKLLEDIGFEAVDNVPISLMRDLVVTRRRSSEPLAIGADIRTRDFAASAVLSEMDKLIVKRLVFFFISNFIFNIPKLLVYFFQF